MTFSLPATLTGRGALRGILVCLTLTGCLTFGLSARAQLSQQAPITEGENVSFEQKLNAQIPLDLKFRDSEGKIVELKEFFGEKPVILSLVYYDCPMLCTLVLNGMVESMKQLPFKAGDEFTVLTISFNHEETHVLAAAKRNLYLEEYGYEGAEAGWHFMVGDEEPIARLTESVGFQFKFIEETGEYAHRSGIIVLTPEGRVSRYFPGVQYSPTDVRLGLVEASQNRIGSLVDRIFLLCYHYDPTVGKYGIVIKNVVNLACVLTVVVLAIFLGLMFAFERRLKRPERAKA